MDLKAALAALKKLEGGAELASVIESGIEDLNSKNYTVIGEKRTETQKKAAYETALTAIANALGIEGDIEAILTSAEGKARAIATELTQLKADKTALETRATTAENEAKTLKSEGKLTQIATKLGVDAAALKRLLGDKIDEIAIDGDAVKVGDKAYKDYVEGDEGLKPFSSVLLPATNGRTDKTTNQKLPPTPPAREKPSNPVNAAVERMGFAIPGTKT